MKKTLIIVALIGLTLTAKADILTLDSCLKMAQQHNCTIQAANLEVAMAEEVKKQVLWKFFPQVDITAFAFHGINPLVRIDLNYMNIGNLNDIFTELSTTVAEEYDGQKLNSEIPLMQYLLVANAKAVQPVYWGGQIVNGNKLAKLGIDASKLKQEISERELLQQVEENYWLVSGLLDKRNTLSSGLALLDTIQRVAEIAFQGGVVSRNDLLRVQLAHAELDTKALQLENGIHLASRALCQLIGMDYSQELEVERFNVEDSIPLIVKLDTFTIDGRPETQLLEMQIKAEQLQKKITIGETLPHVGIGMSGGYNNNANLANAPGYWNFMGFGMVSIPITQWGETSHKIREHNLRIARAQLQKQDLVGKLNLQNEQAYNALTESIRLMIQLQTSMNVADENYRIALLNYQAGASTMTELLEAQTLLLSAQNNYTDARISYRTALRRFNDLNK